ncbi:hypothetical protein BofuT4_P124740.1 [Botrytis cinerea T4]|uniref:Uncharacterized protein n=1 Tax=Botryotinia fuckeliana (strain T4) TaxID=999810 RepID=G2YS28_BOTF4|nr:hypothetical protein BofuT4_P124740.1 [Botrytis cinerea T4]
MPNSLQSMVVCDRHGHVKHYVQSAQIRRERGEGNPEIGYAQNTPQGISAGNATLTRQKEESEDNSLTWSENYDKVFDEKKSLSLLKETNDQYIIELRDELNRVLEEHQSKVSTLESDLGREKDKSEGYSQRPKDFETEQKKPEWRWKCKDLSRQKQIAITVPGLSHELQQQREIATKVPGLEKDVSRLKSISDRVPDLDLDIKLLREEISRINLQGETNQTKLKGEVAEYERNSNDMQKKSRELSNDLIEKDTKINLLELDLETSFDVKGQLEQDLIQKDEIIRQKTSDNETIMLQVTHSDNVDDLEAAFEKENTELINMKNTALKEKWDMCVIKEDEKQKL